MGIGILVLLAGVWVVSIQAGGGGVDLDKWEGNDELQSDTSSLSEGHDAEEETRAIDHAQSIFSRQSRPSTFGPARMDRQSVSESHVPSLAHSPPSHHSLRIRAPTVDEVPVLALPLISTTSPPRSPLTRRGTTPDSSLLLSPSTGRSRKRRRSTLQTSDTQPSFPLPLGSGSVLSGLSIGIGPMSPGFSIVPRDRRRRISGLVDVVDSVWTQRRRTVSEGDIRPWEEGRQTEGGSGVAEPGSSRGNTEETGGKRPTNKGWGWVRRVFLDRK